MKILLISLFTLGLLAAMWELIAKPLLTKKLFHGHARPLDSDTLRQCAAIVSSRKGYPYVCQTAVRLARCPCQPFPKVKAPEPGAKGDQRAT